MKQLQRFLPSLYVQVLQHHFDIIY